MNCCSQGNVTLWILITLLVLGSKDGFFCSNVFNGCGLPIVAALLFCLCQRAEKRRIQKQHGACSANGGDQHQRVLGLFW